MQRHHRILSADTDVIDFETRSCMASVTAGLLFFAKIMFKARYFSFEILKLLEFPL
jgi:hypothetical protein